MREHGPQISLEAIQATGEHQIAVGSYWFQGGARRIDRLFKDFGYERVSRISWDRAQDDDWSVALAQAVDLDAHDLSVPEVTVAVIGKGFFSELYGHLVSALRREQEKGAAS
jgi:hypothetical protein